MKTKKDDGPRVNEEIELRECRLLREDGTQEGVVSMDRARQLAEEVGLDLVEVSPNANPPVVKIIDYGKFKYDKQKQANEAKKKQSVIQLKEIQFRPNIEEHDLNTKLRRAYKFLDQGDKLKMVMQFRGREIAYKDAAIEKFKSIIESVEEYGAQSESELKAMGNRVIAILAPTVKAKK